MLSDLKTNLPRSQSDIGLFAKLKNVCLSSSRNSDNDVRSSSESVSKETPKLSKSNTNLTDIDELFEKDVPTSKSCSDLSYSFKDESDIDINTLLDMRFGKINKTDSGEKRDV